MEKQSDSAVEAFDYIVNTRNTYEMLGEAVRMLERSARRNRKTPLEELRFPLSHSVTRATWRGWRQMVCGALDRARKDFAKCFPEEAKRMNKPRWLHGVDPCAVLLVALEHRDRFPKG